MEKDRWEFDRSEHCYVCRHLQSDWPKTPYPRHICDQCWDTFKDIFEALYIVQKKCDPWYKVLFYSVLERVSHSRHMAEEEALKEQARRDKVIKKHTL
ncbi:MAG: hypothetical protein GY861_05885 [bacterium]|nr:hypothetical protein [bacterium]